MALVPHVKALVLGIVMCITALLGLVAYYKLPDTTSRAWVMIATSAILVNVWQSLHSDRPLAERRRLLAITPRLSDLAKGSVVALPGFPWVALCALAVRFRVLSDSLTTAVIILVPAGVLLVAGVILIAKAYLRAFRGSKKADTTIERPIVSRIAELLAERRMPEAEAATVLGIPRPKLSMMLHGQFREVSLFKLMQCFTRLGHDVYITFRKRPNRSGAGRVSVSFE